MRLGALFELQDPSHARWLPMEGLRGLAVFLVFLVHYSSLIEPHIGEHLWISIIHEIGNSGVDIFFVLSGFLIYKACVHKPISYGEYAYRRVERIYPTFLTVLGLYIVIGLVSPAHGKVAPGSGFNYLLENVLLLPGMFPIDPIITVSWSLSYEVFFYIVAPLSVALLMMREWSARQRLSLFIALYGLLFLAQPIIADHFRLTMFLAGMAVYEVGYHLLPIARSNRRVDLVALAGLAISLAGYALVAGPLKFVALALALVLLVYRCLFAAGPAASFFSWTPLRWLGNASYSYYLMHGLGVQVFFMIIGRLIPQGPATLVYLMFLPPAFVVSFFAALPIYLCVERPLSLKPKVSPVKDLSKAEV